MKPAELHKRVAEILGVSNSQKELAFEVLIESVSDILTEGITLKIPQIGFFQLKSDSQKNNAKKQVMYSALPEDFDPSDKILYHTFDVNAKYKNPSEIESQVFSIGVGKPLLPLHDEDSSFDSETSYVMLRKSIEERVREVLTESDQIPNFNIWEDIYSNNLDDENLEEDISAKLYDLTKDLHFEEEQDAIEPEIHPQHQKFLNTLLFSDKPEASEEFFVEEKEEEEISLVENMHEEQIVTDDLYKLDALTPENNLSVTDLLDDEWIGKVEVEIDSHKIEVTDQPEYVSETISNFDEEQIEITIPVSYTESEKNYGVNELELNNPDELLQEKNENSFDEKIESESVNAVASIEDGIEYPGIGNERVSDMLDGEVLKNLLYDDETEQPISSYNEITIEPPSSAKDLLITLKEDTEEVRSAWAIIEEDLKGIINNELKEYDHEKIANDNSRVLNDLLEDAAQRKVDMDSTDEFVDEASIEESPEDINTDKKIEWSWGDELKEEFGIGNNDEMTEIVPQNKLEIIDEDEPQAEIEDYKFDLERTRQDLFTKLENTLEKEVIALHKNYSLSIESQNESEHQAKPTSEPQSIPEQAETILGNYEDADNELLEGMKKPETKVVENQHVVEFKDEKVILDFKTPPPRYEFIEETPPPKIIQDFPDEPILSKPKRMTILLERSELRETFSKIDEPEEQQYEQEIKPKEQKNLFGKLFVITLAAFIVVTSISVFLYIKSLSGSYESNPKETSSLQNNEAQPNVDAQMSVQNKRESLGLNPDDFSEFPTTATPPEPVKEGNIVDVSKLLEKTKAANTPKNEELVRQAQKEELEKKIPPVNNNKPAGETRLSDMIFFDGKSYNFQISSWKNKLLAQSEVDRLRSLGYNAFLVEAYLPNKGGTWFRIRIGTFKSEQEALDFKKKNSL